MDGVADASFVHDGVVGSPAGPGRSGAAASSEASLALATSPPTLRGIDFRIDKRETEQQHSSGLCFWAPSGRFVAAAKGNQLRILALGGESAPARHARGVGGAGGAAEAKARDDDEAGALTVHKMCSCKDGIDGLEWSPDSQFVLCAMHKRQEVQIFAVASDSTWTARISEGVVAGLVHARWAPDSRHVLTVADFQLHVSVWSLTSKTVYYIKNPKFASAGQSFSRDGQYFAILTRESCRDYLSVYATSSWELMNKFAVHMDDARDIAWSPDGACIAVRSDPVAYCLQVYAPDGNQLHELKAYEHALGIKSMAWAPSGHFLAVGSFDMKCRVLNHLTWRAVATFESPTTVDGRRVNVFREVLDKGGDLDVFGKPESKETEAKRRDARPALGRGKRGKRAESGASAPQHTVDEPSHFVIDEGAACAIPTEEPRPGIGGATPRMGVGLLDWSADSRYLALRNDSLPMSVWVYSAISSDLVAVLTHLSPVRTFKWGPVGARLAIVTGNSKIFFWEPAGATCLCIKEGFSGVGLRWAADGTKLMVLSRTSWTVGHLES